MRARVSITVCLLFFVFSLSAQDLVLDGWIDGWRSLSEHSERNLNWTGDPGNTDFSWRNGADTRRSSVFPTLWSSGNILLTDGSSYTGPIKYNVARNLVQVKVSGETRVYAANQIAKFEIFEELPQGTGSNVEANGKKSLYYSLPYDEEQGSQNPKFFELVVSGNTSLLSRWVKGNAFYNRKLYLINQEGKITEIKKRRGSVIKAFDGEHEELKSIVREERLNMYNIPDVIRLVEAYNELSTQ